MEFNYGFVALECRGVSRMSCRDSIARIMEGKELRGAASVSYQIYPASVIQNIYELTSGVRIFDTDS